MKRGLSGSRLFLLVAVCVLLGAQRNIFAASIFEITVTANGKTYHEKFSSVQDVLDSIDEEYIKKRIPSYTNMTDAVGEINFRGVPIKVSFNDGKKLSLSIPSIGVNEVFDGKTRDDSVEKLKEWFKKDGKKSLTKLMQAFAKSTPNDPIAGNPNSLMANLVHVDYKHAFLSNVSNLRPVAVAKEDETSRNSNLMGLGARVASFRQGDMDNRQLLLPLFYTVRFDNSRNKLRFQVPVALSEVDGARSYSFGLGAGFGWQVTDGWEITPAVNYAGVGSIDLGSVGQIASGSITSAYKFGVGIFELSIGNMVGYYKTLKFSYGEYSFDPEIANTVTRNGLMLSIPTSSLLDNTALEFFVVDTRYFGSELYVDQYDEVGFAFGYTKSGNETVSSGMKNFLSDFRVGATYLFSDESKGITLSLGYTF